MDICFEVSMLSSCLALPCEGHLQALFHIISYLGAKKNAELVFDPSLPDFIDYNFFPKEYWSDTIYATDTEGELHEKLPDKKPKARGSGFVMSAFVNSNHAGDLLTSRSRTGFLIYLNSDLIHWNSKKLTSIETSSFGSDFMAMKHVTEYIKGLRYKFRMVGITVVGCDFILGDNQSVLKKTTSPYFQLKKKLNSIVYHHVCEGVARDEWRTTYIKTDDNRADLCTGPKRNNFVKSLLHHIVSNDKASQTADAAAVELLRLIGGD